MPDFLHGLWASECSPLPTESSPGPLPIPFWDSHSARLTPVPSCLQGRLLGSSAQLHFPCKPTTHLSEQPPNPSAKFLNVESCHCQSCTMSCCCLRHPACCSPPCFWFCFRRVGFGADSVNGGEKLESSETRVTRGYHTKCR